MEWVALLGGNIEELQQPRDFFRLHRTAIRSPREVGQHLFRRGTGITVRFRTRDEQQLSGIRFRQRHQVERPFDFDAVQAKCT